MIDWETGLNFVVAVMIKILFGLVTIMALLMSRQTSLMDRVVNIPIGGLFKGVAFGFFFLCLISTATVIFLI